MRLRRRLLRWLKRIALGAVGLVVLAVIAVLIAVHTDWGRERIRRQVEATLQRSFPGGARIGRIEGSVLGELVVRDVELAAADGAPFASVGTLRIELALLPLLEKRATIDRLVAEDVVLYPQRPIAPPEPDDPDEAPSAWDVELPEIEAHRARVVIETPREVVTLDGVELTAQVFLQAGGRLTADATKLSGTWRERGVSVEGSVTATVDGGAVVLHRLGVCVGGVIALPRLDVCVGGVGLAGAELAIDPDRPTGRLKLDAAAPALRRLVPELALPADARLRVTSSAGSGRELALDVAGELGAASLSGRLFADLGARSVRGVITARDVALDAVTGGALTGTGTAIVAAAADRARIRGTTIATGRVGDLPAGHAVVSFDAALDGAAPPAASLAARIERASGLVFAAGAGATFARGLVELSRKDGKLTVDTGRIAAVTRDAAAASADRAPVRGRLALAAEVSGRLDPLDAKLAGRVDGDRIAYVAPPARPGDPPGELVACRQLHAGFGGTARGSVAEAVGQATGWLRGVSRAGAPIGDADLGATFRADRTIAAWVRARPAAAELVAFARATITPGETTRIALGDHAITMPGGEQWKGRGGTVLIDAARVKLEGLRTTNRDGRIDVGADLVPATGALAITLDATAVAAASIRPAYRGLASGKVRLARTGARWDGTVTLAGRGLVFSPDASPVDGDLHAKIAGRRVVLDTTARTAALGGVRFELDVDGPPDLTGVDGWRRLERAAVRAARLGVDKVDLAAAAIPTGGVVDGTLYIAGADTQGTIKVRGVTTPLGEVEGDITFAPEANSELGATSTTRVIGFGDADVSARIAFPLHPFDPEAWRLLGRGALAHLGASFSDIAVDPQRLAALGIDAPYRGLADINLAVADGATSVIVDVDVTDLSGGVLAQPLDVHVTAMADGRDGTRVRGNVHTTRAPDGKRLLDGEGTMLASFEGAVPSFTIERWAAAPAQARYAPITGGIVTVPGLRGLDGTSPAFALSAPLLLSVFGRTDLAKGTVLGQITIGGTLGTPTGSGRLALSQLVSARRVPGKAAPRPTDLTIVARWGGASGDVEISGTSGDGTLSARANGQPTDRAKVSGSVTATRFDLAPIAAFLPGTLAALEGKLGASLTVRGLDSVARLRGSLAIADAVVPLHPMLGTLRDGTAVAKIGDRGLQLDLAGKLGAGTLQLTATSPGHDLAAIEASGTVDGVSPLGEWEPVIKGKVAASFRRASREQWRGTIKIREASAVLPESGSDLGDPDQPEDLLFVEDGPIVRQGFALGGRAPDRPWLVADLELEPMTVVAEDLFDTRGDISAQLEVSVGETIGLVGHVDIVNGIVGDLFGRRYTATGDVTFDGTLEPKVDITLQHKFTELTLFVKLFGNPATLRPAFSADSGTYTPDQLAGFFLGGEPGGDPSTQTREAATGASVAVVSSALSTRIRKRLPIKIEQLGCDLGSSVSTASCTAGKWFGEKLFVAFKRRIEARPNENVNEGQGQYYLRRDVYVEVVGGDAGSGGVDLLWRRRW